MKTVALFLLAAFAASGANAQYRCVENGKTLFTDKPCGAEAKPTVPTGNSPKIIGDAGNSAYSSGFGDWRGQVQYQASFKGQPVAEAHVIVQTTISIDPQGKISGAPPENGCKLKGIASPGSLPAILNLDITLTGCNYPKLNRRLAGSLTLYPAEKRAQFWIYAFPVDLLNPGQTYDIKGTMRR